MLLLGAATPEDAVACAREVADRAGEMLLLKGFPGLERRYGCEPDDETGPKQLIPQLPARVEEARRAGQRGVLVLSTPEPVLARQGTGPVLEVERAIREVRLEGVRWICAYSRRADAAFDDASFVDVVLTHDLVGLPGGPGAGQVVHVVASPASDPIHVQFTSELPP